MENIRTEHDYRDRRGGRCRNENIDYIMGVSQYRKIGRQKLTWRDITGVKNAGVRNTVLSKCVETTNFCRYRKFCFSFHFQTSAHNVHTRTHARTHANTHTHVLYEIKINDVLSFYVQEQNRVSS